MDKIGLILLFIYFKEESFLFWRLLKLLYGRHMKELTECNFLTN